MLFQGRQDTELALHPSGVVIMDICLNHLDKLTFAGKPSAVIAFPLQNAPEALHGTVVNAMRYAGHTLRHSRLHELIVEGAVGVLESSVTMEQGMRVRIGFHSLIKGLENQRIVIALTEYIGHDAPIAKVEDGAQIEFLYLHTLKPLEFGHIGEPLLIGLCGIKLPVQKIFGKILWVLRPPRAAMIVVLDRGTDISGPADTEHPLVVDVDSVVMTQVIIESPIALIRTSLMDLLNCIRKMLIFCSPLAQLARSPSVVGQPCLTDTHFVISV